MPSVFSRPTRFSFHGSFIYGGWAQIIEGQISPGAVHSEHVGLQHFVPEGQILLPH
jgi:hypothetical protein